MLTDLTIQHFRPFQSFQIDNLARVNLIVGPNSVGKSSLLEAIHLLVSKNPHILLEELEARGELSFLDTSQRYGLDISHLFWGHQLEDGLSLQLKANGEHKSFALTFKQREFSQSLEQSPAYLSLKYGTNGSRELELEVYDGIIERQSFGKRTTRNLSLSHYLPTKGLNVNFLASIWDRITLTPKEDHVIKMLQLLEPNVERISFQSRQTTNSGILIKLRGQRRPLPLGSIGEGMQRILAIAMTLADSENGYLLIDEIDTGLYYQHLTDIWRLIFSTAERLNVQIFATTHSWDCVESFSEALALQQDEHLAALFRLERRKEEIAVIRYNAFDLAIATEQGIEVR